MGFPRTRGDGFWSIILFGTLLLTTLILVSIAFVQATHPSWSQHGAVSFVSVGNGPKGLTYDPTTDNVFSVSSRRGTVYVLDPATNNTTGTIKVGGSPSEASYDTADGRLYVTMQHDGKVAAVDATDGRSVANMTVRTSPMGIAFDPDNGLIYVTVQGSGSVSVISRVPVISYLLCFDAAGAAAGAVLTLFAFVLIRRNRASRTTFAS